MSKEVSTDWKKALAAQVAQVADKEPEIEGTPQISLKHGRMSLNDKPIPDDQIQVVILHARYERSWYNRVYNPDDKSPPDCYAVSEDVAGKLDMHPAENVVNPPSEQCKGCPQAEFGTALQGKGPACKTRLRLAVLPAPDNMTADHFKEPQLAVYQTQPTSVVAYDGLGTNGRPPGYERMLANKGLAPWAVKTLIKLVPSDKKMHETLFELVGPLDQELMPAAYGAIQEGFEACDKEYSYEEVEVAEAEAEAGSKF